MGTTCGEHLLRVCLCVDNLVFTSLNVFCAFGGQCGQGSHVVEGRRGVPASKPHEADLRLLFEGRVDSSESSWANREYIRQGLHILNYPSSSSSCSFSSIILTASRP